MLRRKIGDATFRYMSLKAMISAVIGLIIGGGSVIGGLVSLFNAADYLFATERAEGRVVEIVESNQPTKSVDRFYYAPRIAFTTAAGQAIVWQDTDIDEQPQFKPGETVAMLYRPDQPENARIYTLGELFGNAAAYLGIGLGVLLLSMPRLFFDRFGRFSDMTILLVLAGGACVFGLSLLADSAAIALRTKVVEGEVAELVKLELQDERGRSYVRYRPRIAFTAGDGQTYSFLLRTAHRQPIYALGEKLAVRYGPEDPQSASLAKDRDLWSSGLFVIGFAVVVLVWTMGLGLFHRLLAFIFYGRRSPASPSRARVMPPPSAPARRAPGNPRPTR